MSIAVDDKGNPDYGNATHFPYNIYGKDVVHPLPYFTRDIIDPKNHFEYTRNYVPRVPHPQIPARWGWGHFPNGYGYGNFNLHGNCPTECDPDPQGYASAKTMNLVKAYECSPYYR